MFYVQSANSGSLNLLESDLSVAAGGSPEPIEITLRDDGASLSGNVSLDNESSSAVILAFPDHSSAPPIIQPSDPKGSFFLRFIASGAYMYMLVDSVGTLELQTH